MTGQKLLFRAAKEGAVRRHAMDPFPVTVGLCLEGRQIDCGMVAGHLGPCYILFMPDGSFGDYDAGVEDFLIEIVHEDTP